MFDLEKVHILSKSLRPIGFTASCFDLLHPGHCLLLREASEYCGTLIVGLHRDPSIERPEKNSPIISLEGRRLLVESNRWISDYLEYDTEADLIEIIKELRPDVRFLGDDYIDKDFSGKELGTPIFYVNRSHGWSTSGLRHKIWEQECRRLGCRPG